MSSAESPTTVPIVMAGSFNQGPDLIGWDLSIYGACFARPIVLDKRLINSSEASDMRLWSFYHKCYYDGLYNRMDIWNMFF